MSTSRLVFLLTLLALLGCARDESRSARRAGATPAPLNRDLLEALVARVPATGFVSVNGALRLVVNNRPLAVGSLMTVAHAGAEYDLELVQITTQSFSMRHRGETVSRPIRLDQAPGPTPASGRPAAEEPARRP